MTQDLKHIQSYDRRRAARPRRAMPRRRTPLAAQMAEVIGSAARDIR